MTGDVAADVFARCDPVCCFEIIGRRSSVRATVEFCFAIRRQSSYVSVHLFVSRSGLVDDVWTVRATDVVAVARPRRVMKMTTVILITNGISPFYSLHRIH